MTIQASTDRTAIKVPNQRLAAAPAVPFNRAMEAPNERAYVAQALTQRHLCGDGPFTKRCELLLEETLGVQRALLTSSCTDALEMSAVLLDIAPGDEFIVPSFTFSSTANAFILRGARPVFVDIRPDTMNMDENRIEEMISSRTKAIVPVHYAGIACEMETILDISNRHGLAVVEDNAHGLYGWYRGRALGTLGTMGTQSFHESKNFTCGEGGALLINDPRYIERAEIIREKGTNRSGFIRGQVDKYTWVDIGSSYTPSDVLAAILLSQLEEREHIQLERRKTWLAYEEQLSPWAQKHGVRLPGVPKDCEPAYHLFYLVMPSESIRDLFIDHLARMGVGSAFHYMPLHQAPMGRSCDADEVLLPVTEAMSQQLIRLPLYSDMTLSERTRVIEAVLAFEF